MKRSGPVEGQAAMVQRLMLYGMPLSLFVSGFIFPIGVLIYWLTNNLWTLAQQFYILKKLPPPGSDAAKAKAAADKPAVDPKTLAPKPGAKPVRTRGGRPVGSPTPPAAPDAPAGDGVAGDGAAPGTDAMTSRPPASGKGGQGPANRGKRKRR
jgi:YidC/Oxa1 family membrane protein insertase